MLPSPDSARVLEAVARFLVEDVPLQDPGMSFRLRIAAHLLGVVSRDLRAGEGADRAELARLAALLRAEAPEGSPRAGVDALRRQVVEAIRADQLGDEAREALMASLAAEIRLGNPRFVLGALAEKE